VVPIFRPSSRVETFSLTENNKCGGPHLSPSPSIGGQGGGSDCFADEEGGFLLTKKIVRAGGPNFAPQIPPPPERVHWDAKEGWTPTGVPFSTRGEFSNASADDRGVSKQSLPTGVPT
jgi:hypothetical protein